MDRINFKGSRMDGMRSRPANAWIGFDLTSLFSLDSNNIKWLVSNIQLIVQLRNILDYFNSSKVLDLKIQNYTSLCDDF